MEHYSSIVHHCYNAILKRDPEPEALEGAALALFHGLSLEDFLNNLLHSPEYQTLSGRDSGFGGFTPVCADLGERRLWIDLSDMAVSRVCLGGNYEPHETAFVRRHLAAGDTFLDIGANIGWFTTLAAGIVGAEGAVHAFEPRDETRGLLMRSISDNGFEGRVTVHDFALAAEAQSTRLLWMQGTHNPGGSRLARDADDAYEGMTGQSVNTRALDDLEFGGRVTLVKLDVEGGEANVLRGARAFLARHRPLILTEVGEVALEHVSNTTLAQYAELVDGLGYRIHALEGDGTGRELGVGDLTSEHPFNVVLTPK